jgi:cytochrome c biogenesis protein CcdA
MKREIFSLLLLTLFISVALAQINVYEFYSPTCAHCANVNSSGILDELSSIDGVNLTRYDIATEEGYKVYSKYHNESIYPEFSEMPSGVPLLIFETETETNYLIGDKPIIENAKSMLENISNYNYEESLFEKMKCFIEDDFVNSLNDGELSAKGFIVLIVAALIDSINPCAFGVILFLMISLLNLGSSKRALKAGILYTFVVFIIYYLAGLGLFSVIQSLSQIRYWIYLVVGILVLTMATIEFRDYFMARKGKESILRINPKLKPFIEKYSTKGTILAILILGVVVALFELPCTGGVYIAIIAMLSKSVSLSYIYLLIYNLIFVMPLILLTFLVYKGMSPEKLQKWNSSKRAWMKLGSAIIMLLMAIYLLWSPVKYLFC